MLLHDNEKRYDRRLYFRPFSSHFQDSQQVAAGVKRENAA
jgi:hypothetical protein